MTLKQVKIVLILYFLLREYLPFIYAPVLTDLPSRNFKGYQYLGIFKITSYEKSEKSCGKWADGRTALNLKVDFGICAIDPDIIPLGQVIYIKDVGYFITADTGKKIKGNIIDIYLDDYQKCVDFGIKYKYVYLVKF